MWKDTELAYLAGIMDGEGFFSVRKRTDSVRIVNQIGIVNTDLGLLEWIQERFSGKVYPRPPVKGHPTWKMKYEWRIFNRDLDIILPAILPYLVVKAQQAKLVIELRDTFKVRNYLSVPPELYQKRIDLVGRICAMNRNRNPR